MGKQLRRRKILWLVYTGVVVCGIQYITWVNWSSVPQDHAKNLDNGGLRMFGEVSRSAKTASRSTIQSHGSGTSRWLSCRSNTVHRWIWHGDGDTLVATADKEVNMVERAFEVVSIDPGYGWVALRYASIDPDLNGRLVQMSPPPLLQIRLAPSDTKTTDHTVQWSLVPSPATILSADEKRPGLFTGFIRHRSYNAVANIVQSMDVDFGTLRGYPNHRPSWHDGGEPPSVPSSASMTCEYYSKHDVITAAALASKVDRAEETLEQNRRARVQTQMSAAGPLKGHSENRVIAFGLYGSDPKYLSGALRNADLQPALFPGWTLRFYVDDTVPNHVQGALRNQGCEIVNMAKSGVVGAIAGMFWRFLVADDVRVDRFIVRDADSRLNARDAFAVLEWIQSGVPIHSVRDHPNHERPMNGGLWGGTKGFLEKTKGFDQGSDTAFNAFGGGWGGDADATSTDTMASLVDGYWNKEEYGADLSFLNDVVWPRVKAMQLSHDAYTCDHFPQSKPFPTMRRRDYQHVGQVFDASDHPRQNDIDGFIRGVPVPEKCRRRPGWVYG